MKLLQNTEKVSMEFKRIMLLFVLILSSPIYAEDDESEIGTVETESSLEKILEIPEIKNIYDTCVESNKDASGNVQNLNLETCVWDAAEAAGLQDKILEVVGAGGDAQAPAGNEDENEASYLGKNLQTANEKVDPALRAANEKLVDQFEEAMYGEVLSEIDEKKTRKTIDHAVFHQIYKSRISKGIIEIISSFCMEINSGTSSVFSISSNIDTRKTTRQDNIKKLHEQGQKSVFHNCIGGIKDACTYVQNGGGCPKISVVDDSGNVGSHATKDSAFCSADAYTQQRACEVQQAVNTVKKNILATEKIQERWAELAEETQGKGSIGNALSAGEDGKTSVNNVVYTGQSDDQGRKSINEMTTITSGQLEENMKDGQDADGNDKTVYDARKEELEECEQAWSTDCDKFLMDKDQQGEEQQRITEYGLRTKAMASKLEENLKNINNADAQEELKTLLLEEGLDETSIDGLIADSEGLKKVVGDIIENYKSKQNAIIKSMSSRLNKYIPASDTDLAKQNKITEIREELAHKPEEYKDLLHYSNIVSSYLNVESGEMTVDDAGNQTQQSAQYTETAQRELDNMAASYSENEDETQALKTQLGADTGDGTTRSPSASDDSGTGASFNSNTINKHILYDDVYENAPQQ